MRSDGPSEPLRVVLGEDSFLAREALTMVLSRMPEVDLVASCDELGMLLYAVEDARPDIVLTDIRMPPSHSDEGIQLAQALRSTHPEIGVVVLSQFADAVYAVRLFEGGSGGRGYLLKERVRDRAELLGTLQTVAAGGCVVDPLVVEQLLARGDQGEEPRFGTLTPKELEVLSMIAQGKSNGAIAKTLVVTKRAVERHINNIFVKLDLPETEDLSRRVSAALLYLAAADE